jgi:hypothetical protein
VGSVIPRHPAEITARPRSPLDRDHRSTEITDLGYNCGYFCAFFLAIALETKTAG